MTKQKTFFTALPYLIAGLVITGMSYFLFDPSDLRYQTLILRFVNAAFLFVIYVEIRLGLKHIDNARILRFFGRLSWFVLVFLIGRLLATFIDDFLGLGIGWASNIVNVTFWSIVWWKIRHTRRLLAHPKTDEARSAFRASLDSFIDQLELAKVTLQRHQK